jgi:hypothetical protein
MATSSNSDSIVALNAKGTVSHADLERQATNTPVELTTAPKSLGAGVCIQMKLKKWPY